jgi:hypothetical protein
LPARVSDQERRMKAEHRKELETNALADWIGRRLETLKKGSKNSYLATGVVVLVAALVVGGIWWYRSSRTSKSALWYKFDSATSVEELDKFANANRGTIAAQAARLEAARALLGRGIQDLANEPQNKSAVESLQNARRIYQELAPLAKDIPIVEPEILMGIATAEESLVGSSDKEASLDKALEYYQAVADKYPETAQGKAAQKRIEQLRDPKTRAEIEKFYRQLNERIAKGN